MHHIPRYEVSAGHPLVFVIGLIPFNAHIVHLCSETAVPFGCRYIHLFVIFKTTGSFFHHRKSLGEKLIQYFLGFIVNVGRQFVDSVVNFLFFVQGHLQVFFHPFFQFCQFFIFLSNMGSYLLFKLLCFGT